MAEKIFSYKDIEQVVSLTVVGNVEFTFSNFKPIDESDETSLVWINSAKAGWKDKIASTTASVIVCSREDVLSQEFPKITWLVVDNPRLAYAKIVRHLTRHDFEPGIHPTAYVHPDATLGDNVYVGPMCYVGKSKIGDGTILYGQNFVYDNVIIGRDVTVHAGTIIGSDGFGYVKNESNELEKFPHIGGVVIEDNVEIGANTCIDKGALGNTLVKQGARIDNLVHIAHNVVVGRDSAVIALAMVAGSTIIGDNVWVAPSACLKNGISIGDGATVGLASLVTKNVPTGQTWAGFPARPLPSKK